jgi:hypothetical protein
MWGRATDQVPNEAERPTNSWQSTSARWRFQSSIVDPRQLRQDASSLEQVWTYVLHIESVLGGRCQHNCMHRVRSQMYPHCFVGPVNPSHGGCQHQSLFNGPHIGKDAIIHHTECLPKHAGKWRRAHDDRRSRATHDRTMRLAHRTHHALLQRHQRWTRYRDSYDERAGWYTERELGLHLFPKWFWWLNCPTQIIGLTSLL